MSAILKPTCGISPLYSIFPNPSRNQTAIHVAATTSGRGKIRIYNADGALIKSFEREILVGDNEIPLDVSGVPSGLYQIITTWGGNLKSASFMKQ
jgi:hypothetical protein